MMVMTNASPIRAALNYSVDNGSPLDYYFYEPDSDIKLNPPGTDVRQVDIHDAWPDVNTINLDKEGFKLHDFSPSFKDFDSDEKVKSVFYQQVIDHVKQHTGASRVIVFDHTIRRRLPADLNQQTEVKRPAVLLVHSDYTIDSGPQRVHDIIPDEAEALLKRRVAFFNVWKPLYHRVEELPLAMCDASTHDPDDMLRMELKYRDRTGEIYVMRYSPKHRWMYFPFMGPDQALLLKTYDSETDGRCRFMGHTAFEHPDTPANAQKRESIEVRTMAFF